MSTRSNSSPLGHKTTAFSYKRLFTRQQRNRNRMKPGSKGGKAVTLGSTGRIPGNSGGPGLFSTARVRMVSVLRSGFRQQFV